MTTSPGTTNDPKQYPVLRNLQFSPIKEGEEQYMVLWDPTGLLAISIPCEQDFALVQIARAFWANANVQGVRAACTPCPISNSRHTAGLLLSGSKHLANSPRSALSEAESST